MVLEDTRFFVGRAAESRVLVEHLIDPHRAAGRLVAVEGLPGSGKSSLVLEALSRLDGWRVVTVTCVPDDEDSDGAVAERLFAALSEGAAEAERATVRSLPETREDGTPTVVVIEDAHWLDARSAQLLRELVQTPRQDVLAAILTLHTGSHPNLDHLLQLVAGGNGLHLTLHPFSQGEVAALVNAHAGTRVPASIATRIAKATDGFPLHVAAVARWLANAPLGARNLDSALERLDMHRDGSIVLFDRAIGALVNRAGPAVRATLGLLAVSESPASASEIEQCLLSLGLPPSGVTDALETGLVLRSPDGFQLSIEHTVVVRSVLRSLTAQEIGRFNGELGLRRDGARALRHRVASLLAGEDRWDADEILAEIETGATALMDQGRFDLAFRLLEGASRIDRDRAPLVSAALCAVALGQPGLLGRLASQIGQAQPSLNRDACLALLALERNDLEHAYRALHSENGNGPAGFDEVLVYGYALREVGWRTLLTGSADQPLPLDRLEGAVGILLAQDPSLTEAQRAALVAEAMSADALRRLAQMRVRAPEEDYETLRDDLAALAAGLESIQGAEGVADSVLAVLGGMLHAEGASAPASDLLRTVLDRGRVPHPVSVYASSHLATLLFEAGMWDDARAVSGVALGELIGRAEDGEAMHAYAVASLLPANDGRSEPFLPEVGDLVNTGPEVRTPVAQVSASYALGWTALLSEDHDAAAAALWDVQVADGWGLVGLTGAALLVRSAVRSGNPAGCAAVLETIRDTSRGVTPAVRAFALAHAEGMLAIANGDVLGGFDRLSAAIGALDADEQSELGGELGGGHALHRALVAIDIAEAVRAHPDALSAFTDEACRFAEWAAQRLGRCGDLPVVRHAAGLAAQLRLGAGYLEEWHEQERREAAKTDRSDAFTALSRCTPREREVALLLSRGWGNKEIAAELFLSVRTVEYHVRNCLAKLGLHSRVELRRLIRPAMLEPDELRTIA